MTKIDVHAIRRPSRNWRTNMPNTPIYTGTPLITRTTATHTNNITQPFTIRYRTDGTYTYELRRDR